MAEHDNAPCPEPGREGEDNGNGEEQAVIGVHGLPPFLVYSSTGTTRWQALHSTSIMFL